VRTGRRAAATDAKRGEPLPASGCNKPEALLAEKAVEVVRNHVDGTSEPGGTGEPKAVATRLGVDARRGCRMRGDSHDESHERQELKARATASEALRAHPGRSGDEAEYTRGA